MKSLCLLSVGFSSQYDKKHSKNKTIKFALALSYNFAQCHLGHILLIAQVVSDCSSLVLFNLLVKVLARVADRTCTTQVTLKKVRNALLIHKGLVFTRVHGILSFFLCLVFNFFTIFNMIISNFIFKMTLRRLRNVVTFRVDFYYKR